MCQKFTKIFDKLEELCFQEINLICETIVRIDEILYRNKKGISSGLYNDYMIYDKINLTLNNYNKIIENINKTISSYPGILNIYLIYVKEAEEQNKFIRENIKNEEEKYVDEKIYINMKKTTNNKKNNKIKNKSIERIKGINLQNINYNESKRERMVKFSESVKHKKFKKYNTNIDNKNNKINTNQIKMEKYFKKENLKQILIETEDIKNAIKESTYNNCVKKNEMKNLIKIKKDNTMLKKELKYIKDTIRELKCLYEFQFEKLELLKNEQTLLEKENLQLFEYINIILNDKVQKKSELNDDEFYKIKVNNKDVMNHNLNNNIKDIHPTKL